MEGKTDRKEAKREVHRRWFNIEIEPKTEQKWTNASQQEVFVCFSGLFDVFVFQVEGKTKNKWIIRGTGFVHKRKRNQQVIDTLNKDLPTFTSTSTPISMKGKNVYDQFYCQNNQRLFGPWCQYACVNELSLLSLNIAKWALQKKLISSQMYLVMKDTEMNFESLSLNERMIFRIWIMKLQQRL
jgi:hypothetical protein